MKLIGYLCPRDFSFFWFRVNRVVNIYINNSVDDHVKEYEMDGSNTRALDAADLDGDGDIDIVALGQKGGIKILINDGTSSVADNFTVYTYNISSDLYGLDNALSLIAGNFNGSGSLDIVVANAHQVLVFEDLTDGIMQGAQS